MNRVEATEIIQAILERTKSVKTFSCLPTVLSLKDLLAYTAVGKTAFFGQLLVHNAFIKAANPIYTSGGIHYTVWLARYGGTPVLCLHTDDYQDDTYTTPFVLFDELAIGDTAHHNQIDWTTFVGPGKSDEIPLNQLSAAIPGGIDAPFVYFTGFMVNIGGK